jgi:hypothetical protein
MDHLNYVKQLIEDANTPVPFPEPMSEMKEPSFFKSVLRLLKHEFETIYGIEKNLDPQKEDLKPAELKRFSLRRFTPDVKKIHAALEADGGQATGAGFNSFTFSVLLEQMIVMDLHFFSVDAPEVRHFERRQWEILMMIEKAEEAMKTDYWESKSTWLHLMRESGKLGVDLAEGILNTVYDNEIYIEEFGMLLTQLNIAFMKKTELSIYYDLKTSHPELSREDLQIMAAKTENLKQNDQRVQENISREIDPKIIEHKDRPNTSRNSKERDKIILTLANVIHDDHLVHHPSYNSLNDGAKQYLSDFLAALLSAKKPSPFSSPVMFDGFNLSSLEGLVSAADHVAMILTDAGISDLKLSALERGKSVEAILDFLHRDILRLQQSNLALRGNIVGHLHHSAMLKKAILNKAVEEERLKTEIRRVNDSISLLQSMLDDLFLEEVPHE